MQKVEKTIWQTDTVSLPIKNQRGRFPVRRIYCVGRNYLDHIREMNEADERDPPFFFQKPTDSIVEDGGSVPYPSATDDLQFEVELVIAIGSPGKAISVEAAHEHIFGYAVGIDMTRRDRQRESKDRGLPWEIGKSFDCSAPCSAIVPAKDIGHPAGGALSLRVNDQPRQHGDFGQMIWNVSEIVANLSNQYALKPGDLIFTGTPAGVGPVCVGDRLDASIEGIGKLTLTIS
ncbi:MAG: fumarylacetoacetate hydrolase family protein [Polaromonas sp.]|nr:fumarylacetoacetate hydrolase family protein [Polaromonas sp.]